MVSGVATQILGEDGAQVQQLGVTGKMGVRVGMFTIPKACFFDKRTQVRNGRGGGLGWGQ